MKRSLSFFIPLCVLLLLSRQEVSALSSFNIEKMPSLYRRTPLIHSAQLTELVGKDIYLKLDALQPSGSFKDRGMAHLCETFQQKGVTQLISSSGGNAGLAVATVGCLQLKMQVQVVVPKTTKQLVVQKLQVLGADVTVTGENWNEADAVARQRVVDSNGRAEYVSPYDNPLLWTGHSTVVDEILEDLPNVGCIVVSVGGGGLICGVLEGLSKASSSSGTKSTVKVIAAETEGASSFGQAFAKGEVVTLPGITTVATSLGATSVTPVALERSKEHGNVKSAICTDQEAVQACLHLAKDHRILVEPACGAALSVAYSERLRSHLADVEGPIVLEVCGGSGVNIDLLHEWKQQLNL